MNRIDDNLICFAANEEIVRAFDSFEVEFLVVGGLAVSWYCSARQAHDMDLLINPTPENSVKVFRALSGLGISGIEENTFARRGVQAPLKQRHHADVITPAKTGRSYEEIAAGAISIKIFGFPARVPSVGSLIALKEAVVTSTESEVEKHRRDIFLLNQTAP